MSYKLVVVSGWKKEGKNTNPESDKKGCEKGNFKKRVFCIVKNDPLTVRLLPFR